RRRHSSSDDPADPHSAGDAGHRYHGDLHLRDVVERIPLRHDAVGPERPNSNRGAPALHWGVHSAVGVADGRRDVGRNPGDDPLPSGAKAARGWSHGWGGESVTNPIGVISMFYARPFTREQLPVLARTKRAGGDFIGLPVPEPAELDLGVARSGLDDHGLGVVLAARVNLDRDLASPDKDRREAGVRYLEYCVETAARLGGTLVGGPLYGAPLVFAGRSPAPVAEPDRSRKIRQIVDGLASVAARASDVGVRLCIEPLNRFETDIANTTDHALALADAVASPSVGVMLDTFHMNMEDSSIPDAIRRAGVRLFHFQANENHRGFVGSGHIDWPGVCRALAEVEYTGPITLEPFRRTDDVPGTPLAQWRAPHKDEDEELAASIAFLRCALRLAGSVQ